MGVKKGLYRHFKGNFYEVLGVVKHSETDEELVLYKALYGERKFWVRSFKMFTEEVIVNGERHARFYYLGVKDIYDSSEAGVL